MEIIKLNQFELSTEFSDCHNLKQIVNKIENICELKSQVLTKLWINGLVFSEEDEIKFSQVKLSEIQSLAFEAEKKDNLVQQSVQNTRAILQNVKNRALELADSFRAGVKTNLHADFTAVVTDCHLITQALMALKPHLLRQQSLSTTHWAGVEEHLLATVQELIVAYEAQDLTLVSDILEYELSTSLDQWLGHLNQYS